MEEMLRTVGSWIGKLVGGSTSRIAACAVLALVALGHAAPALAQAELTLYGGTGTRIGFMGANVDDSYLLPDGATVIYRVIVTNDGPDLADSGTDPIVVQVSNPPGSVVNAFGVPADTFYTPGVDGAGTWSIETNMGSGTSLELAMTVQLPAASFPGEFDTYDFAAFIEERGQADDFTGNIFSRSAPTSCSAIPRSRCRTQSLPKRR